jgi:predicted phosphoadenosine phosphosulfate sulfurtransferase
VLELAAMVNNERGQPNGPLTVCWLDQECEFQATVDYQRHIMYERDDINFRWYQIPFKLENSTNLEDRWAKCWDPDLAPLPPSPEYPLGRPVGWVRDKEPTSIHDNTTGEWEFVNVLSALASETWDGCIVDGIRAEESPARRLTTTSAAMYKWCTWCAVDAGPRYVRDPTKHRFRFHPVYDWSYRDVWKAIHDNNWRYNKHYDHLFQYGVKIRSMRVSNYHHESALASLHWLQEIEPQTWEAATRRLQGISTYGQLKSDQYPKSLPYMFKDWDEYLHYLIDHLVQHESERENFRAIYRRLRQACADQPLDTLAQVMVGTVIGNDFYGVHAGNFMVSHRPSKLSKQRA